MTCKRQKAITNEMNLQKCHDGHLTFFLNCIFIFVLLLYLQNFHIISDIEQIFQYFIKQFLRINFPIVLLQPSLLVSLKLFLFLMTLNRAMLIFELILDYVISHAGTIQNNKKISHPTKIHQLSLKLLASRTSIGFIYSQ